MTIKGSPILARYPHWQRIFVMCPSTFGIKPIDWRETIEPVYSEELVSVLFFVVSTFTPMAGGPWAAVSDLEQAERLTAARHESKMPARSRSLCQSSGGQASLSVIPRPGSCAIGCPLD